MMQKQASQIVSVEIDRNLCDRQGVCVELCPEVFGFDEDDEVQVIDSKPGPEIRKKVEFAKFRCPKYAISIGYA